MQYRRLFTLIAVLVVAAAGAVPAFARGSEKLAGIERALEVAAEAVEWARTAPAGVSDSVFPQTSSPPEKPSGDEPQQGGSGEAKREERPGKGSSGKGSSGKGSSGKGSSGKGSSGKGSSGKGNAGEGSSGNGNSGNGNSSGGATGNGERASNPGKDKSEQVTGRDRAAAAIAATIARGSSKDAADKDIHAAEVLAGVLRGEAPPILEGEAGYGAHMSAMIKAYNDLRDRDEPGSS